MSSLRVGSIVIRVDDLPRQLAFWSAALGYVPRDLPVEDDGVVLRPREGAGPNVTLDRVHSEVHLPPRIHLDLYAADQLQRSNVWSSSAHARSSGTSDQRTPTTSSSRTPKATASA